MIARVLFIYILSSHFMYAQDEIFKHSLQCDMIQVYEDVPKEVASLSDMFCDGIFYARLRSNSFFMHWGDEVSAVRENSLISGLGGSIVYKSAYLHGFSVSAGLYTTQAKGSLDSDRSYLYRSGRDTFNRHSLLHGDHAGITTFAQAYAEYKYEDSHLRVGRQLYESFLTASNDTKMIPNSFEGISLLTNALGSTVLKLAYLTKQKLRDRNKFHHLLAYGDDPSDPYARFTQNDDSGMHRGITLSQLRARGIEDRLFIAQMKNSSLDNLVLNLNYTAVPKLLSYLMVQADYRFDVNDWSVIPGFRYMTQFDDGAGTFAGANLRGVTTGYSNPNSLDAALYAARVDVVQDVFKLRFGYTKTDNKADIVAPWRGFPTAGFTRAMAQNNWYANTQSYMMQLDYEFERIENFKILTRFAVQDFDNAKRGVQADSKVFTFDATKSFPEQSISFKTRFAHVTGEQQSIANSTFLKPNPSYNELRFEINYLF